METFDDIGGLMRFLSYDHDSPPEVIPETFIERMAAALDDDAYGRRHIEKILRGDVDFTENSDPIDGEGREQKVHDLVEKYQEWRYSERWLFLSAATSEEEKKQRAFEFGNFKNETGIPAEDITEVLVEDVKELHQIVFDFMDRNKGCGRPMNILVLGHGSLKCTTNSAGKVIVGNGQLAMLVNIEHHGHTRISFDNDAIINLMYEVAQHHQIGEDNRVRLCLFYCHAHARDKAKVFDNFKVITYKDGKNPGSLLVRDKVTKELVNAENNALPWLTQERDKEESGKPHSLYPVAQSASVKASSPETEAAFLPSSDGQREEKDVPPFYDDGNDLNFFDEVNQSGQLGGWVRPLRNMSIEEPKEKLAEDSTDVKNSRFTGGSVKSLHEDISEEYDIKGKGNVTCCVERQKGEDSEFQPVNCCDGVNEGGETVKEESQPKDSCNRKLGGRFEVKGDVEVIVRGFQKASLAMTQQVEELPTVELTSGNPGEDDGRQGWVSRTWGRVKDGLGSLDWYSYL